MIRCFATQVTVIAALLLWRLDYCNAIHAGLPATTLQMLQRVMNAAARTELFLTFDGEIILLQVEVALVTDSNQDQLQTL